MQLPKLCAVAAALLLHPASGTRGSHQAPELTPLGTLIDLLETLLKESEDGKDEEEVQHTSEMEFCKHSRAETEAALAAAKAEEERLSGKISQGKNEIDELVLGITEADTSIGDQQSGQEDRKTDRAEELTAYANAKQSYTTAIESLKAAIATLKKQEHNRPQSLLQTDAHPQNQTSTLAQVAVVPTMLHIPAEVREALAPFLQDEDAAVAAGAPEAHGYEFKSGSVIDTLEQLLTTAIDKRTEVDSAAADQKHAYDAYMASTDATIKKLTKERDFKAASKKRREEALARDTEAHSQAQAAKSAAEASLQTLNDDMCPEGKQDTFDASQTKRQEEIDAIKKAIELLESPEVKGYAATYLSATQIEAAGHGRKAASLASLRASLPVDGENARRAHEFLLKQAGRLHSDLLETIASKIQRENPLADVIDMITDLITRLKDQALEEGTHSEACEGILAASRTAIEDLNAAVNTHTADVETHTADLATASATLAAKTSELNELEAEKAEAEELKQKNDELNQKTIDDSEDATTKITEAQDKLNAIFEGTDFPKESSESITVLLGQVLKSVAEVQQAAVDAKATDLEKHTEYIGTYESQKESLEGEISTQTERKGTLESSLADAEDALKAAQDQLAHEEKLIDAQEANCLGSGTTHEERTEMRNQEIQSLEEVLKMLDGTPAAML